MFRIYTVDTNKTVPNCCLCNQVLELARQLHAPFILERESGCADKGRAWGEGHLVIPSFARVEERLISEGEFFSVFNRKARELGLGEV